MNIAFELIDTYKKIEEEKNKDIFCDEEFIKLIEKLQEIGFAGQPVVYGTPNKVRELRNFYNTRRD